MKFLPVLCSVILLALQFDTTRACNGLGSMPSLPPIPTGGNPTGSHEHGGKKCLHKEGNVLMADGRTFKKAGDLVIGDRVWSEKDKSTPVILTPETEIDVAAPFVTFETQSGLRTTLTPSHAVFARPCGIRNADAWPIKRSDDLSVGECVPTVDGQEDKVVSMSLSEQTGRVHPITENGKIPVDGLFVSCYDYATDNVTQEERHAPLEPMRQLYSIAEKIYYSFSNEQYALGILDSLIRGMGLEKFYYQ